MSTPYTPASWSSRAPHALTGSAHPSCCLCAIFRRKCFHTPAHSSSNGSSSRNALERAATTLAAKAKAQHDLRAKHLSVLQPGTVVRLQYPRTKRWDMIADSSGSRGGGGGARGRPPPRAGKKKRRKRKKIGPGIRQVRPPQHDV